MRQSNRERSRLLRCGERFCSCESAAVDAEIEPLLRDKERFRYEDQRRVARALARQGKLRAGASIRKAADIIWALASERIYLALVQERGWSVKQYEAWLTDQLVGGLLPD